MNRMQLISSAAAFLGLAGLVNSASAVIIADGVQPGVDSTTWVTAGDATLGGQTTGFDWTVSGLGNTFFVSSGGQGTLMNFTTEWPTAGTQSSFGITGGYTVGVNNLSGATDLRISVVVPAAGEYSIFDGNYPNPPESTQLATATGQILQWVDTAPSTTKAYSVVASTGGVNNGGFVGAVGFSVPEPASLSLLGFGGLALLARRRCV